ncbi:uncharacterized protein CPUR_05373 [Claviceps purpurea 20.1]|uniref:Uncharacterized protein n=1 Tax=Claviceps purpurea (strain 20.1) TaxID=1111077 RepID=M1W834_CLAP2|nr:uncharacterized protein CPUR_05373 [Claviceps purpurea 20.1]
MLTSAIASSTTTTISSSAASIPTPTTITTAPSAPSPAPAVISPATPTAPSRSLAHKVYDHGTRSVVLLGLSRRVLASLAEA